MPDITPSAALIAASILILAYTLHRTFKGYRQMLKQFIESFEQVVPVIVSLFGVIVAERDDLKVRLAASEEREQELLARVAELEAANDPVLVERGNAALANLQTLIPPTTEQQAA